ncbi:MAG: thermonuclease family protein [Planctomycetaceae bacterium]|nr:thermonuclease family protein [Planctomycetaceae bacterium]
MGLIRIPSVRIRQPTPLMVTVFVCLALLSFRQQKPLSVEGGRRYSVRVRRVFDGDTFETVTGQRVRLLGIDAPEVAHGPKPAEPYSQESTEWLQQLIDGSIVTIEEGVVATDRYGRTLAWVYLTDGRLISELALATGNARLLSRFGLPLELEKRFRQAQASARQQCLGMWGPSHASL